MRATRGGYAQRVRKNSDFWLSGISKTNPQRRPELDCRILPISSSKRTSGSVVGALFGAFGLSYRRKQSFWGYLNIIWFQNRFLNHFGLPKWHPKASKNQIKSMFGLILGQDGSNERYLLGFTKFLNRFCCDFCLISERCWDQYSFDYNAIERCMLQQNSMRDHLSYTAQTNSRASGTSAYCHLLKASSEKTKSVPLRYSPQEMHLTEAPCGLQI